MTIPNLGTLNVDTNTFTPEPHYAETAARAAFDAVAFGTAATKVTHDDDGVICETAADFVEPSPMGRGVNYTPNTGCGLVYCDTVFYYWSRWIAHEQFRAYSFWLGIEGVQDV